MNEFGRRNWEHTAIKTKCAQTRNWNTYDPQCWKGRCWLLDQARTGFLGPVSRSHVNGEFLALIGGWNGTESPDTGRIISQSSSEPVRLCQRLTPEFQGTPGLSGVPNFVCLRETSHAVMACVWISEKTKEILMWLSATIYGMAPQLLDATVTFLPDPLYLGWAVGYTHTCTNVYTHTHHSPLG